MRGMGTQRESEDAFLSNPASETEGCRSNLGQAKNEVTAKEGSGRHVGGVQGAE